MSYIGWAGLVLGAASLGYVVLRDREGAKPDPETEHPLPPKPTPDPSPKPYIEESVGPFRFDLTRCEGDCEGASGSGHRWRVFQGSTPLGQGLEASEEGAAKAARAFIASLEQSTAEPSRYGARVGPRCDTITLEDPVAWVAWASPQLQASKESTLDTMGAIMTATFPDCEWPEPSQVVAGPPIPGGAGRSVLELAAQVDSVYQLPEIRSGATLVAGTTASPSIWDRAAAALLGGEALPFTAPRFAFQGYVITIVKGPLAWRWSVRRPGGMVLRKGTTPGKMPRDAAVQAAQSAVGEMA